MENILTDIKNSCDEETGKKLNMLLMIMKMKNLKENMPDSPQHLLDNQPPPQNNNTEGPDNYNGFMNLINKVIKEKEEE